MGKPQLGSKLLNEDLGEIGDQDHSDLLRARQAADKLSAELGEPVEVEWFLVTKWLQQLQSTHRLRAENALTWRPRFLAALRMACSYVVACRAAKINYRTYRLHVEQDPEFKKQCQEAREHGIEMLLAAAWNSALRGDLETIFWQGKEVAQIRKADNRLRLELLRAYMPDIFKTPGSKVNVDTGNQTPFNGGVVVDQNAMQELIAMRQESLRRMAEEMAPRSN